VEPFTNSLQTFPLTYFLTCFSVPKLAWNTVAVLLYWRWGWCKREKSCQGTSEQRPICKQMLWKLDKQAYQKK